MNFKNEPIGAFLRIAIFVAIFSYLTDLDISNVVFGEIFPVMVDDIGDVDFLFDGYHLIPDRG